VTIVGSIAARLTEKDSGLALTSSQVLTASSEAVEAGRAKRAGRNRYQSV
jgi:hypothetical protein